MKKGDPKSSDSIKQSAGRRRLLGTLAVGAAAEVHALLPSKWTKPVVESIVLPAHAQMSPGEDDKRDTTLSCNAGSLTVDNAAPATEGHVAIIYDGDSSCSLLQTAETTGSGDADEILLLDADNVAGVVDNYDLVTNGTNWGGPATVSNDNGEGSKSVDVQRVATPNNGTTFRVTFDVSFSGTNMTVSNVQIMSI